jgi:hypothetical protein
MYKPKNFELYEFLPRDFYNQWYPVRGEKLWTMFDDRVLRSAQAIRERYGKMEANTWYWPGGKHQYRGWRPQFCEVGAKLSDHKGGRALDLVPAEESVEKIRADILADPFHPDFVYITALEMNISWLHIATRNWDKKKNGILKIYP